MGARDSGSKDDGSEGDGSEDGATDDKAAADREARELERYGIDEDRLTPVGVTLPRVGFVPEGVLSAVGYAWMGLWIALFVLGQPALAMVVMFPWIGASGAWEQHRKKLRRRRKREIAELRRAAVTGAPAAAALPPATAPAVSPAAAAEAPPAAPPASPAERTLLRTLRRVERSDRLERRDVVLVTELTDVLFPLLARVAQPGADALVRHDVEKVATEHLPDSVEAYLALPPAHAREHRNAAGRTALEELRVQLDLLLTGCEQLQEAVLEADVSRQQAQSRFLEQKFRRSSLDL